MYPNAPPVEVDHVISDEGLSLSEYGIGGQIVYTPGHTTGSLSIALADDIEIVKISWRYLLNLGVHTVYPGHGEPFPIGVIQKALIESSNKECRQRF
jgi:glyoxylase-like metal-dependent hydrolase (beta-lactamase superfamily II)